MLKKFVLLLTIIAMLGTMISMPAFASEESTPTKYSVALKDGYWAFSKLTECSALYGKSDGEKDGLIVFNNSPTKDYAGGTFVFDKDALSDGYITVNEGDVVKFTVQLAWDDMYDYYSRLASNSTPANYIINFRPLGTTGTAVPGSYLNDFGVSFKPQDGIFQQASSGPSITGTQTPFMVPEKNWCTYDFVYTIGSATDGDKLNVYADGVLVLKDQPTKNKKTLNAYKITGISLYVPCSKLDTPSFAYDEDNFSVTYYPKGSTYTPVANAFNDAALDTDDIKFAGLPDGSLHYIGSDAQPSNAEMQALIKAGFNVTTEFVVSSDAANDPGRIGYIKMTHNDGTVRYKKVMGGKVVDLISLNFNDRESLDATKEDGSLASGSVEGYHMGYGVGTKGTTYEVYYKGGSLGKKADNYAIHYDAKNKTANQGLFFSSQLNDTYTTTAKMSATGIISYEFSLRIPDGVVGDDGVKQFYVHIRNKSDTNTFTPFTFDGRDNRVYYCKKTLDFKDETEEHFDSTLNETQWNRYAVIVNTLTDEVSIYRNGVFKWNSPAKYKLTSTGVMAMQYTSRVNADFYVDDVVIRSVTPDYVPETFAPEVISDESASWTNNEWRYACSKESTAEEFKSALNVSEDCEVIAYNSDYTPAPRFSEAKVIAVKNEDESIIRYYDVVPSEQVIEYAQADLLDVDFSADSSGTLSDELTFTSGTKRLTATCHSYKDEYQNLNLIVAAYNDNTLVALNTLYQRTSTGRQDGTITVDIVIPEGETVTKFKVFAMNDDNTLENLKPWRTSVEWTKIN